MVVGEIDNEILIGMILYCAAMMCFICVFATGSSVWLFTKEGFYGLPFMNML